VPLQISLRKTVLAADMSTTLDTALAAKAHQVEEQYLLERQTLNADTSFI
jgi:hypothetical protein